MSGKFTGRHMAAILVAFFGVVVAVNVAMARLASETFGGIVVENSYVASQEYNKWLGAAAAQQALGWQAAPSVRSDGHVALALDGVPADAQVSAIARHPLGRLPDVELAFVPAQDGYLSQQVLPQGRWILRLEITSGTDVWRHEGELRR